MRVWIKYDTPNEKGKTGREIAQQFIDSDGGDNLTSPPEFLIPDGGLIYWEWYQEINSGLRRVFDGVCFPIPWSEFLAWGEVSGNDVIIDEFAVLRALDVAFCDEMNKELQAYQERQRKETEARRKR